MRRKTKAAGVAAFLIIAALSAGIVGCSRTPGREETIARIGDDVITVTEFNDRIAHLPVRYQEVIKKRKKDFLQEIINDTLLYQEAVRNGLDKDEDVQKVIGAATVKILIARYLKDNVDDTIKVTEEDIITEYNANKDAYMMPETLRASHILLPSKERAEGIREELDLGASFDELARAKSIDPTAQTGGDIGYFPKGQLMPEFENACNVLEVGEISGPVKSKLGYHIIMLTDRKEPVLMPIDRVRDKIASDLYRGDRRQKFNLLLKRLNDETEIEINEDILEKAGE
ncbi:MAG: peptidylprolyl isomerase [Candidatus Omnitrophica bacterium]|nr:peptidylprolyl isomerase [Candidatus Omnitrophota bacterium]MBU1127516.1 peptidylprolyl isomerase [Candidatus Omnitrophota bacterium]MBU1783808.1 peptidylprolyl isomerase [Candidatus Omnitrophota bacterium]MBU1851415.1 peptidylprolyl isomerase [Candidatus Omnitrophota bacterium]